MQNNNWTSAWPTEPGNYWFHGWTHKTNYKDKPRTYFVRRNILGFVLNGQFLCEEVGAKGLWLPAEVPEPSEFNIE